MAEVRRPLLWSPQARADLFSIWSYHREVAGEPVADKLVREIGKRAPCSKAIRLPAQAGMSCGVEFDPSPFHRMSYSTGCVQASPKS
jgi:hypothetical protein